MDDLESATDLGDASASRAPSVVDTFHFDPIAHAQNQEPALTPEEKLAVLHASKVTRDNHTQLFHNFEMPSADSASPYSCAAKGYTSLYSKRMLLAEFIEGTGPDAKIRFSARWESIISVLQVPDKAVPEGMTEQHMLECVKRLRDDVAVRPSTHFEKLTGHVDHVFGGDCGSAKDSCRWGAYVSGHGQLLGIYKKRGTLVGEKDTYYLVAHSDSGVLGQALCEFACKNPGMTLGEFASSPQMARVKDYSRRVNSRLLARLVAHLGFDRSQFKLKEDTLAHVDSDNDEAFPDKVAGLLCKTIYNCFYDPQPTGDSIIYYSATSRLGGSKHRYVAQLLGPQKGILLCEVIKGKDYRVACTEVMKEGGSPVKTYHENHFCSWPVGIGKSRDGSGARIKASTLSKMHSSHVWLGKEAESKPNDRLTSYKVPGDIDIARNRFILGTEHSPDRELYLTPVASIVAPPERE